MEEGESYLRLSFDVAGHEVVMLIADAYETAAIPLEVVFRHPTSNIPLVVRDTVEDVSPDLLDFLMRVHVRERFNDPDLLWWQEHYFKNTLETACFDSSAPN